MKKVLILAILLLFSLNTMEQEKEEGPREVFTIGKYTVERKDGLFQVYYDGHYSSWHRRTIEGIHEINNYLDLD